MVEGIELRNPQLVGLMRLPVQKATSPSCNGLTKVTYSESVTMACNTLICYGNSGDPAGLSNLFESMAIER